MKTSRIIIGVTVILILAGLIWALSHPKEPTYLGKSVSEWTEQLFSNYPHPNPEAVGALRAMGEPAIEHLTWMLEHEDSTLKLKLLSLSEKSPWLQGHIGSSYWSQYIAARALGEIGPPAASAIPALERISKNPDGNLSRAAKAALVLVRNEQLESYIRAYQDRSTTNYIEAYSILMELGPHAKSAIPVLLQELQSTNSRVRIMGITVLHTVGVESEECVGPLIRAISDPESTTVQTCAISALSDFGDLARPAVPLVLARIEDTNSVTRMSALAFASRIASPTELAPLRPQFQKAVGDSDPTISTLAEQILLKIDGR